MTIEELITKLQESAAKRELRVIEQTTGVNYGTLRDVKDGRVRHPRIDTFTKLVSFYERPQ